MNRQAASLLHQLASEHCLPLEDYCFLIEHFDPELGRTAQQLADRARRQHPRPRVYLQGLFKLGNLCINDCYFCDIRCSNPSCRRYRLTGPQVLACCEAAYELGYRSFLLEGGQADDSAVQPMVQLLERIHTRFADCELVLALGELKPETYRKLRLAGATGYLLWHETADETHYSRLHPGPMQLASRMECLHTLRALGYRVGCGFISGAPYETPETLAKNLKFAEEFAPEACGVTTFTPRPNTPFRYEPAGSVEMTLFLTSLLRLIHPELLIPALKTLGMDGIRAGANLIAPTLSPLALAPLEELQGSLAQDELLRARRAMEADGFEPVMDIERP